MFNQQSTPVTYGMTIALLAGAIIALAAITGGCSSNAPTGKVLTNTAQEATGLMNMGTITSFPYATTNMTIFEDVNRGTVCYILESNRNDTRSISCAQRNLDVQQGNETRTGFVLVTQPAPLTVQSKDETKTPQ